MLVLPHSSLPNPVETVWPVPPQQDGKTEILAYTLVSWPSIADPSLPACWPRLWQRLTWRRRRARPQCESGASRRSTGNRAPAHRGKGESAGAALQYLFSLQIRFHPRAREDYARADRYPRHQGDQGVALSTAPRSAMAISISR